MNTPWDQAISAVRRLKDQVDLLPVFREATQYDATRVIFDTDTAPTVVRGTLANGVPAGSRVLTMTLRHYVWVLGVKNGASPYQPPVEPYFLAQRSTAASIPNNAWTACNMAAANEVLIQSGLTVAGSLITVQKAGVYTISAAVKFTGATGGNSRGIALRFSDYPAVQQAENNPRGDGTGFINAVLPVTTTWTGPLAAGCTIELVVIQNSGAALNAERLELGIAYIGPRA